MALKMAGVEHGPKTLAYIQRAGGIPKSRVFTKCFLALLGHWPWQRIVPIPPEMILLPPSAPFSVYNFACWARQTVVPLSVVWALRPVRHADLDLREIGARPGESRPPGRPTPLRRRAIAAAERWVKERQEADGSWGGIQPPWVWSIVMLAALGRGFEDETLRRAVEGWGRFMVEDGERLRPEACQSPVWDTGLAVLALRAARRPGRTPAATESRRVAARAKRSRRKGDWAIRRPDLAPGGWAFEFENDLYPDVDDTAVVALALRELGMGEDAVRRGPRLDRGHAVGERRLGRLRCRQLELLALQAPVLRLRLRDRPAERGRLRARPRGPGPGDRYQEPVGQQASSTSSASSSGTAPGGAAGA